jgi:hypothetical protein
MKRQVVLLEERYYAACCLQFKVLCTGDKIDEKIVRKASAFELQSGEGESKIFKDDIVVFQTYQAR